MERDGMTAQNWAYASLIGCVAGVLFGGMHMLFHYMHFSEVRPDIFAQPFFLHRVLKAKWGWLIGLSCTVFFSWLAANLYQLSFAKLKGPWLGLAYGAMWWVVLFATFGPWFHWLRSFSKWKSDTLVVEACLFLLWGIFVGYSISFKATDVQQRQA
jgi:hypothetical protein